jgi:hypothetical protein
MDRSGYWASLSGPCNRTLQAGSQTIPMVLFGASDKGAPVARMTTGATDNGRGILRSGEKAMPRP